MDNMCKKDRQKAYELFKEIVSEENDNDGYSNYMLGIIRLESFKYDKETLNYFLKSAEKRISRSSTMDWNSICSRKIYRKKVRKLINNP